MKQLAASIAIASALVAVAAVAAPAAPASPEAVAAAALRAAPVWDGHNDVPEQLRVRRNDMLAGFDFRDTSNTGDAAKKFKPMQTDLTRLRRGQVGAQFWSVYVDAGLSDTQAVQATIEQIDLTRRLIAKYPDDMQLATTSAEVVAAMRAGKIASLMGMEGGHSIGNSLAVLRQQYALGARYMTLAHFKNNAWADSATDAPVHGGLTDFGKDVVREMQRIGMLVDLSHVAQSTMMDALDVAKAPVMFSHSGSQAINGHARNVSDAMLDRIKPNGGIVMVNTYATYVGPALREWIARQAGQKAYFEAFNRGDPAAAAAALAAWTTANPAPPATIAEVADHIDHIVRRIGVDHVGIGGDFDGIELTTQGMDDVSTYPALFVEMARRGYSQADLQKIASGNMMRVLRGAEAYAAAHRGDPPIENPTTF